jgi:hypothetical protein
MFPVDDEAPMVTSGSPDLSVLSPSELLSLSEVLIEVGFAYVYSYGKVWVA